MKERNQNIHYYIPGTSALFQRIDLRTNPGFPWMMMKLNKYVCMYWYLPRLR